MFQVKRYSSVTLPFRFTSLPLRHTCLGLHNKDNFLQTHFLLQRGKTDKTGMQKNLTIISFKDEIHFSSCKSCCNHQDIFTIYPLLPEKQPRICALNGTRNCFRYDSTTHDKSEGLNWDQVLY